MMYKEKMWIKYGKFKKSVDLQIKTGVNNERYLLLQMT